MKNKLSNILAMSDRVKAFIELTKLFEHVSDEQRLWIRQNWDFDGEWNFPNPYRLAEKIDGQALPIERLRASMIYDLIAGVEDSRELIIGLCLSYHSAIELGLNPQILFLEIARIAPKPVASQILSFAKRCDDDKSLDAFCFKKINLNTGVKFERI